ncbi:MAG: hypothetical protein KAT78_01400 [Flavobacteriaceae bacterium]|nr:hypothetical protein [Flavobacteriaceae bacterium]
MKKIITILVLSLIFIQCNSDKKLLIAKNNLGDINKSTTIIELDKMFSGDSIVKLPEDATIFNKYKIYNKEGKQIITVKFNIKNDSVKGIENIKIFDSTYKTDKELSTSSTYKDIMGNYSISKVEPSFNSAIVFVNEINATVAIDKKDLKIDEFDMRKISKDQIPDMAKIQYITLWFD